jgi:predicted amidophosphoribosyltransferase
MKKSKVCTKCKGPTKGKGTICRRCVSRNQPKKFTIKKEKLEELVKKYPMTIIGKKFGVTDNAIRKRCKRLGVEWKKKSG